MTGNLFPLFLKTEKCQFNSGEWTEHVNNSLTRKSEFKGGRQNTDRHGLVTDYHKPKYNSRTKVQNMD